ncbi:sensor histidine kinase [Ornithinibacillus xuwenensis]|uniref:histidine kinase n=1 Tax=Ornithinibacillus xuwenensis TaxID=3144668 RepID=A0ABU9XG04_9BACI
MIRKYLIEKLSWILLFLALFLLIAFVAYVDSEIPLSPILYIILLASIIFTIFMIIRYQKETKFYKRLEDWDTSLDLTNLVSPETPFEKIIVEQLTNQTEQLKEALANKQFTLEQEKDDLLAWIHEVKTPLTAMQLIMDRLEDKEMKAQLLHEWMRIHLLLDQQLHQRRIHFIENDLYMERIDLKSILYQEIKALQSWCMQKRIGFDLQLEQNAIYSDGKWVAFITRQLLTNAIKYSKESEITIKTYEDNSQVKLAVIDSGRGIDPKDLPRIFDKGFTSTSNHEDHAATGMGLYLAKKAAESLFIEIKVVSTLGTGTTFILTFPKRNDFHHIVSM